MVLAYVKIEEMCGGEVFVTFRTSICVHLGVVDFEVLKGGKGKGLRVRCERAFHSNRSFRGLIGYLKVFCRVRSVEGGAGLEA